MGDATPQTTPSTMKAWTYSRAGVPTKTLQLVDIPVPSLPTPTSVLVKVSHVSLHPGTSIIAQIIPFLLRKSPAVAETDFSGTIVAVGERVAAEGVRGNNARRLRASSSFFGTIAVPSHLSNSTSMSEDAGSSRMQSRYVTERMSFALTAGTRVLTNQRSQGTREVSRWACTRETSNRCREHLDVILVPSAIRVFNALNIRCPITRMDGTRKTIA